MGIHRIVYLMTSSESGMMGQLGCSEKWSFPSLLLFLFRIARTHMCVCLSLSLSLSLLLLRAGDQLVTSHNTY